MEQLGATREEKEKNVVTDGEGRKTADSETVRTVANIEVRLGAIYALERIARENLDFHWQIMEILCAYVRENGRMPEPIPDDVRAALSKGHRRLEEDEALVESWEEGLRPPRADVQAALTVIGRRGERQRAHESKDQRLDLRGAGLASADLSGLRFDRGLFVGAHLERASLDFAHLEGAWLIEARLEGAVFGETYVEGAKLSKAVGLSQKQVDKMHGNARTTLPDGLTRPAHWTVAEPDS